MDSSQIITNQEAAEKVIRSECVDMAPLTFINHGYHNLIAAVGEEYVFRFPRDKTSLGRFDFEIEMLQALDNKLSIQTPHVIKKHLQPAYAMLRYIPGNQLENKQLRGLPEDTQRTIGQQLTKFVQELNQVISLKKMRTLHDRTAAEKTLEPWEAYLKRIFAPQQKSSDLQKLIDTYYEAWQVVITKDRPQIVVHDDLHSGNLLFKDEQLSGVLDFEHATIGTIEQEFRYLYLQGGYVLEHAVVAYEHATGQTIDHDDMRVWAIISELAAFVRRLNTDDTSHVSYLRARAKLRHLIKDFPL